MLKRRGYSLLELTIVLTIISIMATAILAGKNLIKKSKLNSLVKEITELKNSVIIFRETYEELPGDLSLAHSFFGTVNSCLNVDVNDNIDGCNGNGNGVIEFSAEGYRANQHLVSAGLILDKVNGVSDELQSKIMAGAKYHILARCTIMGHADMGKHCIQFGGADKGNNAALFPKDLYIIDNKLDDGKALSGFVRFRIATIVAIGNIVDLTTCGNSAGYHINFNDLGCNLVMQLN
ncbi:MAG: type II secretion system protein [Rickettsiales bacterium]